MARLVKESTAKRIEEWLRDRGGEDDTRRAGSTRQTWVIVQCDSDTPLAAVDNIKEQLFPGTVLETSERHTYPDSGDLLGEMFGVPVLLTVLSGDDTQDGPYWVTPKPGKLYFCRLHGTVKVDSAGSLIGRPRAVGVAFSDLESPLTTKGDIWAHDGTTDVRFPVDADGKVLTADSSEPTGLKWATSTAFSISGSDNQIVRMNGTSDVQNSLASVDDSGAGTFQSVYSFLSDPSNSFIVAPGYVQVVGEQGFPVTAWWKSQLHSSLSIAYTGAIPQAYASGPGVSFRETNGGTNGVNVVYNLGAAGTQNIFFGHLDGITDVGLYAVQGHFGVATPGGMGNPPTLHVGYTGTLKPGMDVTGGVITTAGSGSFVSTASPNTFTADQTINSGASVPALNLQQTSSDASDTLRIRNAAGTTTATVTGAGNVTATSFTGSGSGLTGLNASELGSGTIPDARFGTMDFGSI